MALHGMAVGSVSAHAQSDIATVEETVIWPAETTES
jgi:hypothetical protein